MHLNMQILEACGSIEQHTFVSPVSTFIEKQPSRLTDVSVQFSR